MTKQPKPIEEQVLVITGASSGIGRETALQCAKRGASIVIAARNKTALTEVSKEIERLGGKSHVVVADVSKWEAAETLAQEAVDTFGHIDTWINNAAVSEYASVEDMTPEEIDRIIQVIMMGQIYSMKVAVPIMKQQRSGTIINVASALAARSVPLQAAYCAAKHGIKGFTEALRLELAHEKAGINVTLIMPSSINTPLFNHARSKMDVLPMPIPPIYEPTVVAESILFAAENPRRDIVVGGSGKLLTFMERLSPTLVDKYMLYKGRAWKQQKSSNPDNNKDNLFEPFTDKGSTTGEYGQKSKSISLYTRYIEHYPQRQRLLTAAALLVVGTVIRKSGVNK